MKLELKLFKKILARRRKIKHPSLDALINNRYKLSLDEYERLKKSELDNSQKFI